MPSKKKKSLDGLSPIELYSPSLDSKQIFKKNHAEKILRLSGKGRGDWEITDKKLTFSDGAIIRTSQGETQNSGEQTDDK